MLTRNSRTFAAIVLFTFSASARPLAELCGTHVLGAREEVFLHRQSAMARVGRQAAGAVERPAGKDYGDTAVIYASGGVLARRNAFNLTGMTLAFVPTAPNASGYRFTVSPASLPIARDGDLLAGLGDDDTRHISLPFPFPFYGKSYTDIYVNSDGNLSFTAGDTTATSRSLGFFVGGVPRIGVLLDDLDPTRARAGSGVFVESAADHASVRWLEVPEYSSFTSGLGQIFQATLFPDGRIELTYQQVTALDAVVGITPGQAFDADVLSFLAGSTSQYTGAIAERFSGSDSIDTVLVAQRFYRAHEDAYDYLAVYNTLGISPRASVVANELTVRNNNRFGFGDTPVDMGLVYGSASRMQAMLNMGPLSQYPRDPLGTVLLRLGTGDTPLSILAHETGHLFLALVSYRDPGNPDARPMLTSDLAHWSFNLNSGASFLGGSQIEDQGPSASPRFHTVGTVSAYSALDQYLMGFRPPEEVPPTFLVTGSSRNRDSLPEKGAFFSGTRRDIAIEEISGPEGRRTPDSTVAQRGFRTAFILVVPDGTEPAQADLAQLDGLRSQFPDYYAAASSNRGTMETTLRHSVRLSVFPAAGVAKDNTFTAKVTLDAAAEGPLTVLLSAPNGVADVPASIEIPDGAREAAFAIRGIQPGVEELTVQPAGATYMTAKARIQVMPALDNLTLVAAGADSQTATFRVTDANLLPYPGVRVTAVASSGSVDSGEGITNDDGYVVFQWTPGDASATVQATISGTAVTVTATQN